MSEVKHFQHIAELCQSTDEPMRLYPMATQYVLASDYDHLEAENRALREELERLKISHRSALDDCKARWTERDMLAVELEAIRSRLVVVTDEREAFEAWLHTFDFPPQLEGEIFDDERYPDADCFGQFVYDDHSTQRCWAAWQARARLNGKTVIESTLRQIALALNCLTSYDFHGTITHNFGENWADRVNGMRDELNALFCEGKEVES